MRQAATTRRKFIAGAGAACLFALAIVAAPTGRSVAMSALLDFVEITERVARLPCWIVDHSKRLSLDRLDPTCPQCM
jgi:hypothetical protein